MLYRSSELVNKKEISAENRTITFVFSTGFKDIRHSVNGPFYEELSMDPSHVDMSRFIGSPFLIDHVNHPNNVIGRVDDAFINDGVGYAIVKFGRDAQSQQFFEKYQDILEMTSTGYRVFRYEKTSKEGESIPTYKATRWMPVELSCVGVGFDPKARIVRKEDFEGIEIINLEGDDNMDERQRKENLPATDDGIAIYDLVLDAGLSRGLAKNFIGQKLSLDQVRMNISEIKNNVEKDKERSVSGPQGRIEITQDEIDIRRKSIVSALTYRADNSRKLEFNARNYVDMPMYDIGKECLPRHLQYGHRFEIAARAISSQSDLGIIMHDFARVRLAAGYNKQGLADYKQLVTADTLNDLRVSNLVRFDSNASELEQINENEEYTFGSFGYSEHLQMKLLKYGRRFRLSMELLINDEFGAVNKFFTDVGSLAAKKENKLVFEELFGKHTNSRMADGKEIYDPVHKNVSQGPCVISDDAIENMIEAMQSHKISPDSNDFIENRPKFLVFGPKQERHYNRYVKANLFYPDKQDDVKLYQSRFTPVMTHALGESMDWYCVADPAFIEGLKVFYLSGHPGPQIFHEEEFAVDASQIKVRHFFGVKAIDYVPFYKNIGNPAIKGK